MCLADCGAVATQPNGQINLEDAVNTTFGATANVTCDSGFDASTNQVTCLSNGSWSWAACLPKGKICIITSTIPHTTVLKINVLVIFSYTL